MRPRGKESTEVRISQKEKESENSLSEIEEITVGQAHENTRKLYRNIAIFVVCSQTFALF